MAEHYRNFKKLFWVTKEHNVYTLGFNEDAIEAIEKIHSVDFPAEGETVDGGSVCGSIDTDKGPVDIYAPVSGTVSELNSLVIEEPSLIQDDPFDSWLMKIESDDMLDDIEEEDEEEDEDYEEEDTDEDEEEEDYDEEEEEEE